MNIGYARVSTTGQDLQRQLDALEAYGVSKIYQDKASGMDSDRKQHKECIEFLREGDVLVITRLDRLARSTLELCKIMDQFEKRGVSLVVINQNIDTSTPTGKLLFHMLAAIAEFETGLRSERQQEGIERAKQQGVAFGRKRVLESHKVAEMVSRYRQGSRVKDLMGFYGISKASVYRLIKEYESDTQS